MSNTATQTYVSSKKVRTPYPLIDSDPHFKRVIKYTRTSDYVVAGATASVAPLVMLAWEQVHPSLVGKGGFPPIMRLTGFVGLSAGFLMMYQRSTLRFYGMTENKRELDMDMREMVTKVKAGEPLYGKSTLTPYMQGVASRNSRYTGVFLHVIPWFNFVNHDQHGVDTAKYYQQAERELEAKRTGKPVN
ncbi:C-terminal of NADH-ubiquinone oxidoreductase 21 kDa subunit-domain-containing protein [Amylocarpus encephaloides]|uniref:C-terminal of NADH-ubiquinone oxidoreductase 21 kDa subunit-domain-containing protein n=1 Tax=Amylocarpus encephaloides TaxID=45428 RepID=A0A9P7Y9V0_9HELO|nr:C-terminal of NADH-ubiquinone oxidoreductase 21 kDa subunit-domain-containing protein [Amylocarpus encephaloides]